MKRVLRKRKDEILDSWCQRLAIECEGMTAKELYEVLHEVSVTSYIEGSNVTRRGVR